LELDGLHVSRRLARRIRRGEFEATCDCDFNAVILGCATARGRRGNTWLTADMIDAYRRLHRLGHAHSIEIWRSNRLAGGIYGVAIGGFFAAESMFCSATDASKAALVHLVGHLAARGYQLLDVQQRTPHTERLGVVEITRREYLLRLSRCVDLPVTFGDQLSGDVRSRLSGARG
jgi:leucyl/phenylalanyl-tRNA--protein transferase